MYYILEIRLGSLISFFCLFLQSCTENNYFGWLYSIEPIKRKRGDTMLNKINVCIEIVYNIVRLVILVIGLFK